jgi:hypothetical protein
MANHQMLTPISDARPVKNCKNEGSSGDVDENKRWRLQSRSAGVSPAVAWASCPRYGLHRRCVLQFSVGGHIFKNEGSSGDVDENKEGEELRVIESS